MCYTVYIIETLRKNKKITYTGYTKDLNKRIDLHNTGKGAKFTKGSFWKLVYKQTFDNKTDALRFEINIKKNRNLKLKLINT